MLILALGLVPLKGITQIDNVTKHKMFCEALSNHSTAPNYVVITVKNIKTGAIKEICTESNFVSGAISYEPNASSFSSNCKDYPDRYFEFSQDSALWNIGFDLYSSMELIDYAKTIDLKDLVQQVKAGNLRSKTFTGDRKEQIMFAHLMFNNGVMMTSGCIAGNICGLTYFESK